MPVIIISVTNFIFIYRTINHVRYNYQCNQLDRTIIHARYDYHCNNFIYRTSTMPVIIISVTNFIIIYRSINHARYNYQRNQLYNSLQNNQSCSL